MKLKTMKLGKSLYKVNKAAGYFPYFTLTLRQRIKRKMAVNVAVVGEAGISKSYMAFTLCRELDPTFTVDQIVFTYSEYLHLLRKLRMGKVIMFDEPSYALSKRDWYKQLNKVLVKTIESQRFKVHPLFIPIINIGLLDKTIRDHLVQYVVHVLNRGFAYVYRLYPSQWEEKVYHVFICSLRVPLTGHCKRDSCLGCRKMKDCQEFRAAYERKKSTIQDKRYEMAEDEAKVMETKELSNNQIANMLYVLKDRFVKEDGLIDAQLMRIIASQELGVKIGYSRAYAIRKLLCYLHPDDFQSKE